MQRALLDHLACPACLGPLGCHVHREVPGAAGRQPGIDEGLLTCDACGRWFPIAGQLPELLPDHLRDPERESALFHRFAHALPAKVRARCEHYVPGGPAPDDPGAHHKRAEIGIRSRVENPDDFFGPGYSAPFNPHNTEFSLRLVQLFGALAPLLECRQGAVVIDSGCGYAWTTEWLHRSGLEAIGVDICRTYLEIAMARIGPARPHLVLADVEYLPLRSGSADAVLAYESFHHVPDRSRAMCGYSRALKPGGRFLLAEPGREHDQTPVAVDAMAKFGILEKGMALADVAAYAAGTAFGAPEQLFPVIARHTDLSRTVVEIARLNTTIEGNIFRLRQGGGRVAPPEGEPGPGADDAAIRILATEAPQLRQKLADAVAELQAAHTALAQARDRIFHMERSLFWRMRGFWLGAAGLVRRARPGSAPSR